MSVAEARSAIETGGERRRELIDNGHDLLVTGEMGIGNTTPAAALIAAFTGHDAHEVTGRGAGIDDATLAHKTEIVAAAVTRTEHLRIRVACSPKSAGSRSPRSGLRHRGVPCPVPLLVDGLIACAATVVADALAPGVRDLVIAGHRSVEPGASIGGPSRPRSARRPRAAAG